MHSVLDPGFVNDYPKLDDRRHISDKTGNWAIVQVLLLPVWFAGLVSVIMALGFGVHA
jgi:hypothetical protein